MSIVFIDGFDHYSSTGTLLHFTGTGSAANFAPSAGAARNGPYGLRCTSGTSGQIAAVGSTFAAATTVCIGFAIYIRSLPTAATTSTGTTLASLGEGTASPAVKLVLDQTGKLRLAHQSSFFTDAWSGTALTTGRWYYIEMKCHYTSSSVAGDLEVRVDYIDGNGPVMVNRPTTTGQNTRYNGSAGGYTAFTLGDPNGAGGWSASTNVFDIDDLYVLNSSGTTNNSYLGNSVVDTYLPNGAGASSQFTPSGTGAANYQRVNEAQYDGDTTYVSTAGVGNRDSYAMADSTVTPVAIYGVDVAGFQRVDASETTRKMNLSLRVNGTYYDGTTSGNLTASYTRLDSIWELNPDTSAAWTRSDIDGLEAGVKLVS